MLFYSFFVPYSHKERRNTSIVFLCVRTHTHIHTHTTHYIRVFLSTSVGGISTIFTRESVTDDLTSEGKCLSSKKTLLTTSEPGTGPGVRGRNRSGNEEL